MGSAPPDTHSGTLASALKAALKDGGNDPNQALDRTAYARLTLLHNRARGDTHETMAKIAIRQAFGPIALTAAKRLDTPFGLRILDLFHPDDAVGFEVKSGRAVYSSFVRRQIRKDRYLIENGTLGGVVWILFAGGSSRLLAGLRENGLAYVDITGAAPPFHPTLET